MLHLLPGHGGTRPRWTSTSWTDYCTDCQNDDDSGLLVLTDDVSAATVSVILHSNNICWSWGKKLATFSNSHWAELNWTESSGQISRDFRNQPVTANNTGRSQTLNYCPKTQNVGSSGQCWGSTSRKLAGRVRLENDVTSLNSKDETSGEWCNHNSDPLFKPDGLYQRLTWLDYMNLWTRVD